MVECGYNSVQAGQEPASDVYIDVAGLKWPSQYIQDIRARDPTRVNKKLVMFETKRCLFCHKNAEFKRIRRSKLHDPFPL